MLSTHGIKNSFFGAIPLTIYKILTKLNIQKREKTGVFSLMNAAAAVGVHTHAGKQY